MRSPFEFRRLKRRRWGCDHSSQALMRPLCIVLEEVGVEHDLHLTDGLEPGLADLDAEVFVEQRAANALDDPVRLRPPDPVAFVLSALELQEKLVEETVLAAGELATGVGRHAVHGGRAPRGWVARRC